MKQFIITTAAVMAVSILFNSCSIEKRRSVPGYHIEWKHRYKAATEDNPSVTFKHHEDKADMDTPIRKQEEIRNEKEVVISDQPVPSVVREETKTPASEPVNTPKLKQADQKPGIISVKEITQKLSKKSSLSQRNASSEMDKATSVILAILVLLIGLFPLSVYLVAGGGRAFRFNLLMTLLFFLFMIIGAFVSIASSGGGIAFIIVGVIFAFVAFIHAIVMIIKRLID